MTDRMPARPSLDGLEARWIQRWDERGVYRFDRSRHRDGIYSIDTPPPTVSGSLHVGHVFSYTQTDAVARYQRMRGREVFYPMGWDDNGLPTERRVQNHFGVRCDPSLPYDPDLVVREAPERAEPARVPVSRPNFIELCERLTVQDEQAFEALWRRLGLSVDWSLTYQTIDERSRRVAQRAFLRNLARGEAYLAEAPTLWDVTFQTAVAQAELEDRPWPGTRHRVAFHRPDRARVVVETTRPELLPACVALVTHPDDQRYRDLHGTTVRTPVFGVEVPVLAHRLADPEKGTGLAMVCTFGDTTDVVWWRELRLATRPVAGRDGRLLPDPPPGLDRPPARTAYQRLAGADLATARERTVELLREAGDLVGEPAPIVHPVKFYERGEVPLEIVTTRQWYIRNGGRDPALRDALLARGRELAWHPEWMRARYESWVDGLAGDWLVSRQRYFGVPVPVWYPLDADGEPAHDRPLLPDDAALPVDPGIDPPPGYRADQRGRPGGFAGDPDVMDTWATSSLTPQIVGGWGTDPDLFGRVFPMDLRPQAHEIIRTWLFATVVRAHLEHGTLPWSHAVISGWVLDPDRKKMSKSRGRAVTPVETLETWGSDAVRYWALKGRPGGDTTFDTGQMRIGRRLAVKLLNASRYVLGVAGPPGDGGASPPGNAAAGPTGNAAAGPPGGGAVGSPLDRAMLAELAGVVEEATAGFDGYDHARALERTERFFWRFCDDYLELAKSRAYGRPGFGEPDVESARTALRVALSTLLRLLAPFLPFVTEEVWSWFRDGSVHRAAWPDPGEVRTLAGGVGPAGLEVAGEVIAAIRRAKSEAKLSMRAEVGSVLVRGDPASLQVLGGVADDVRAAGRVGSLDTEDSGGPALVTEVRL
jgi:valyl-tRNA synthetase